MNVPLPSGAAIHTIAGMASITSRISLSARRTESSRGGFMSLAVRLFVIDYAFIHSSGKAPAELSASFCLLLGVNGVLESNRQYRDPKESLSSVSDAGGVGD